VSRSILKISPRQPSRCELFPHVRKVSRKTGTALTERRNSSRFLNWMSSHPYQPGLYGWTIKFWLTSSKERRRRLSIHIIPIKRRNNKEVFWKRKIYPISLPKSRSELTARYML
jgi:hypothetical protein